MVLLQSVQGARVTQRFGRSVLAVEPSMWFVGEKAYWLPFLGASFSENFHPGIDRAAPTGTQVLAMEAGHVVFAGWKDNVSGNQVEVEIRPNTRYSVNHLALVRVKVGQSVGKADVLGTVGSTGASTGPHTHEGLSIREQDARGVFRTFLYDPELFQRGGDLEHDERIDPLQRYVRVNGPGINIRKADQDLFDRDSIFAVTRSTGIYRVGTGKRLSGLKKAFAFIRWRTSEDAGQFAVVTGYGRRLAIHKSLVHFV